MLVKGHLWMTAHPVQGPTEAFLPRPELNQPKYVPRGKKGLERAIQFKVRAILVNRATEAPML